MSNETLAQVEYSRDHTTITVKHPNDSHLDGFLKLPCAPELIKLGVFPDAKEITESFAAYVAVKNWNIFNLGDPETHLFAVGDGSRPRTAALFAHTTNWQCHSIDPNAKMLPSDLKISRLTIHPKKIEDVFFEVKRAVVVAVHSHAPLDVVHRNIKAEEKLIVAIPCCKGQKLGIPAHQRYTDWGIHSPHRTVKVWKIPHDIVGKECDN